MDTKEKIMWGVFCYYQDTWIQPNGQYGLGESYHFTDQCFAKEAARGSQSMVCSTFVPINFLEKEEKNAKKI